MINIAIFASGKGSNALSILKHIQNVDVVRSQLIVSNNNVAGVLDIAQGWNIETKIISRKDLRDPKEIINTLINHQIDLIILAGFLWKIPNELIDLFLIVNIHPALLPQYGGKGMYGHHVHEAVKDANEEYSGITIHWVNDKYDDGKIIMQQTCKLSPNDSAEDIAAKVLKLEHKYYPQVVLNLVKEINQRKKYL